MPLLSRYASLCLVGTPHSQTTRARLFCPRLDLWHGQLEIIWPVTQPSSAFWSTWAAEVSILNITARSKNKEQVKNALCYDDKTLVSRRSTDLLMIYFSLYSLRQRITLRYRIPLHLYLQLDLISHCPSTHSPPLCTSDAQRIPRTEEAGRQSWTEQAFEKANSRKRIYCF